MLLPLFVLTLATLVLVIAYQNTKSNDKITKIFLLLCYLLIIGICVKYGLIQNKQLLESFEVQMPDMDDDNNFIDLEDDEGLSNTSNKKTNSYVGSTIDDLNKLETINPPLDEFKKQMNINNNLSSRNSKSNLSSTNSKSNFEDIIQKDSSGTHSVFKPQIIINTNDGTQTEDLTMHLPNSKVFIPSKNESSEQMKNVGLITQQSRNEILTGNNSKSKDNLFANLSFNKSSPADNFVNVNSNNSNDAFNWIKKYQQTHSSGNNESNQYVNRELFNDATATTTTMSNSSSSNSCNNYDAGFSSPYAEEATRGRFNPASLSDQTFIPGMQYLPPSNWQVPQPHPQTNCNNVCSGANPNTRLLPIGIMDYGTPINALEIGSDGTIAKTEDEVFLTNVGSILPKFEFRQYIDCYSNQYATANTSTTNSNPTTTSTTRFNPTTTSTTRFNPTTTSTTRFNPTTTSPNTSTTTP